MTTYYFSIYYRINPTFHENHNLVADIQLAGNEIPDGPKGYRRLIDCTFDAQTEWDALEKTFHYMQGEVWSPEAQASPLIEVLGLKHTSMSIGDLVVNRVTGQVFECCGIGFEERYNLLD
jgi:hypothetical protein